MYPPPLYIFVYREEILAMWMTRLLLFLFLFLFCPSRCPPIIDHTVCVVDPYSFFFFSVATMNGKEQNKTKTPTPDTQLVYGHKPLCKNHGVIGTIIRKPSDVDVEKE